ncbi:hypothetical protein HOY80DRAFT_683776 [Tuber brumale]|nr:hypothetical protein HOY80DRAFT_683776 [Tuber brumale]
MITPTLNIAHASRCFPPPMIRRLSASSWAQKKNSMIILLFVSIWNGVLIIISFSFFRPMLRCLSWSGGGVVVRRGLNSSVSQKRKEKEKKARIYECFIVSCASYGGVNSFVMKADHCELDFSLSLLAFYCVCVCEGGGTVPIVLLLYRYVYIWKLQAFRDHRNYSYYDTALNMTFRAPGTKRYSTARSRLFTPPTHQCCI